MTWYYWPVLFFFYEWLNHVELQYMKICVGGLHCQCMTIHNKNIDVIARVWTIFLAIDISTNRGETRVKGKKLQIQYQTVLRRKRDNSTTSIRKSLESHDDWVFRAAGTWFTRTSISRVCVSVYFICISMWGVCKCRETL